MRRVKPGVPVSGVEQNGHMGWKAWVPCGSDVSAQYFAVLSEHTWPQETKACVGAPAST